MKKLVLALLLPMAFALPSCTDTEAAFGVGLVGGTLFGASLNHHYGYRHYRGYNRPYYGCVNYGSYDGGYSNECGYGYGYGSGYWDHGPNGWNVSSVNEVTFASASSAEGQGAVVSERAAAFAINNGVSFTASEKLSRAFDKGAQGDFSSLAAMGLTTDEFAAIYDGNMPSSHAMAKLSRSLNLAPAKTAKLMKQVVQKVQERRTAGL